MYLSLFLEFKLYSIALFFSISSVTLFEYLFNIWEKESLAILVFCF